MGKDELVLIDGDVDRFALEEVASDDFLGERIFEVALDGAAHGPRPVLRVVALVGKEVFGFGIQFDLDVFVFETFHDLRDFEIENLHQVRSCQGPEHDHFQREDGSRKW